MAADGPTTAAEECARAGLVGVRDGDQAGARIVFDALAARFGGTAEAVMALARHLARHPGLGELVVVVTRGSVTDEGLRGTHGMRLISVDATGRLGLLHRLAWETFRLPRLLRSVSADVVMTFSGMLPWSVPRPIVCDLSNGIPLQRRTGMGIRLRRWAMRRTGRRAAVINAPTRYHAQMLEELIGRDVNVQPWGVDHDLFVPAEEPGSEILYVADFYEHKRHDIAIEAWSLLPEPRPILRFVGDSGPDPETYRRAQQLARKHDPAGNTILLQSRIPHAELPALYRSARLVLLTSEHETFALPLAEALASGVPAVVRDFEVLRETGGSGVLYVASNEAHHWTSAISRLLIDDDLYESLRAKGTTHARRFSWERYVDRLVETAIKTRLENSSVSPG